MSNFLKSPIFLIVFVLAIGLMAGCSSKSSEGGSDQQESSNSGGASSEDGGSEGAIAGELEIQYFVGGYGDSWWKKVIADFQEEYPDVTVTEHAGPNINDSMRSRWISNDPPDVVYIDGAGSNPTQMVEDGQLMNLTEWIEGIKLEDGTPLLDSFIVDPSDYDGGIYTLPLVFDVWGTWYNSASFEEKNYEVPTDFDSFMETMGKIKDQEGISPFVTTGQHPTYFLNGMIYPGLGAAGGNELLSKVIKGEEGIWESPEVQSVMEKVVAMRDAGYIDPGFASLNHTQSQMNFLLQKNAFIPVGFWLPNEMANDIPEGFEFGFIPSPMNDSGENYAILPDLRPLAVAEKAENKEAALAFVEFVFQREYATLFSEHTGALMNMEGVDLSQNENVPSFLIQANAMINDPEQVTIYKKPHVMSFDMETAINNAMISLMLGNINLEEFTKQAEAATAEYRSGS